LTQVCCRGTGHRRHRIVVGGIVIMNIMLMSVRERTREIAFASPSVRRSATSPQFLAEAISLATLGGAFGTPVGSCSQGSFRVASPLPAA